MTGAGGSRPREHCDRIGRRLAEGHPQDTAEGLLDLLVLAKKPRQLGLAEPAGAAQGRGNRDRLSSLAQDLLFQGTVFARARDEPGSGGEAMNGTRSRV